jgi:hypothetical protein
VYFGPASHTIRSNCLRLHDEQQENEGNGSFCSLLLAGLCLAYYETPKMDFPAKFRLISLELERILSQTIDIFLVTTARIINLRKCLYFEEHNFFGCDWAAK